MKKQLFAALSVAAVLAAAAVPAGAVTFEGKSMDGPGYSATIYGPLGMQFGTVYFLGDRARAYLSSGEVITLRLNDSDEISDPSFISGTSLGGQHYRIQLKNSWLLFGPMGDQMPLRGGIRQL